MPPQIAEKRILTLSLNVMGSVTEQTDGTVTFDVSEDKARTLLNLLTDQLNIPTPIRDLKLSKRAENCLLAEEITTIEQLLNMTEVGLLKIPNLGRLALHEIKTALNEYTHDDEVKPDSPLLDAVKAMKPDTPPTDVFKLLDETLALDVMTVRRLSEQGVTCKKLAQMTLTELHALRGIGQVTSLYVMQAMLAQTPPLTLKDMSASDMATYAQEKLAALAQEKARKDAEHAAYLAERDKREREHTAFLARIEAGRQRAELLAQVTTPQQRRALEHGSSVDPTETRLKWV